MSTQVSMSSSVPVARDEPRAESAVVRRARRLGSRRRRMGQTFGLELDEIAELLQEREATLRRIREGVVAVDPRGRVRVVNDEAWRLLELPRDVVGRPVDDVTD